MTDQIAHLTKPYAKEALEVLEQAFEYFQPASAPVQQPVCDESVAYLTYFDAA